MLLTQIRQAVKLCLDGLPIQKIARHLELPERDLRAALRWWHRNEAQQYAVAAISKQVS